MPRIIRKIVAAGVATAATVVVTVTAAPAADAAPNENCGVRVDLPHPSGTTSAQIHTRVESF